MTYQIIKHINNHLFYHHIYPNNPTKLTCNLAKQTLSTLMFGPNCLFTHFYTLPFFFLSFPSHQTSFNPLSSQTPSSPHKSHFPFYPPSSTSTSTTFLPKSFSSSSSSSSSYGINPFKIIA